MNLTEQLFMDVTVLSDLLQEKGWQVIKKRREHLLLEHSFSCQTDSFIIPALNSEQIPAGTFNAMMRLAHARKESRHWTSFINDAKEINVILEKQTDKLWGRIEIPGLLIATSNFTADGIADSLRALLIEFSVEKAISYCSLIASLPFVYVYDTTAVWSLVRLLKATHIAEQAGIDTELITQFMTGNTYPCPEVATRLEESIHELGRQLMGISIR